MAHKEHTPRCTNNCSGGGGGGGGDCGGRLSKKLKNKKVPQRGMGVAQLEKIISEEHQKNDVPIPTPNSTNFRPPPPPPIPLPTPLPPNHHRALILITDSTNPNFVSKPTHTIVNGGRLWSGGSDYRYELENPNPNPIQNQNQNQNRDLRSFPITTRQRSHLFQQQCSSTMMELPSNQSYCGNYYPPPPPLWPDEEKNLQIIGMKRPYPFPMENIPIPSIKFNFPFSSISRSNESASCSHGCTTGSELPVFREKSHSSSLVAKDFLTLGPPRSSSKEKAAPLALSIGESSLPENQGQSQTKAPSGSDRSNRQPLYSFFPAANNNGEEGEVVDLNLKL